MEIQAILNRNNPKELRALFAFDSSNSNEQILFKFNIWSRFFFVKYFTSEDCKAHKEMDLNNLRAYRSEIKQYVNVAFRGLSKTARTKLFIAFCIANDLDHTKRFIRCISADLDNAKQSVTDIFNMFIQPRVKDLYPEIFEKSEAKREETMTGFTTTTGIKVIAKQISVDQRGKIMEEVKSDFDWYDDIETKTTIRSAITTQKIKENMEEARTGLALNGSSIYTCNYFSEAGNVHNLVTKKMDGKVVQITPILTKEGLPTWDRYSLADIEIMRRDDDDFEGERMCSPNASKDVYIDRECLDRMPILKPIQTIAGFKIFKKYNPSHRYAGGMDIAGGVGLDSSTSVFIDFDCFPAQVVATYASNTILPEAFGDEIYNQANYFGGCLIAPENNKYDQTILKARQLGAKLYTGIGKIIKIHAVAPTTFGWNTNSLSKSTMFSSFREAVESGLLSLNDEDLINEAKSYTRNDIIDNAPDIRLTTRHHDLLIACFVKGTMVLTDKGQRDISTLKVGDCVLTREGYKPIIATMCSLKKVINNIGLTGTADHPVFCNDNEIKNLSCIEKGDILYKWDLKAQNIERLSFTGVLHITDTQTQNKELIESTIQGVQSGNNQPSIYIEKYGKIILVLYQKVLLSIIKTAILIITLLKTCTYCLKVTTCDYTCLNQKEKNNLDNLLRKTEQRLLKELGIIIKIKKEEMLSVNFVEKLLKHFPIMQFIVLGDVQKEADTKKEKNLLNYTLAMFVGKILKHAFHIKKDVQQNVVKCEDLKNIQPVYNIQVADCPEYFANNILVHNCAIAWQMRTHARVKAPLLELDAFKKDDINPAI
jgi:hypothetical protein